MEAPSVSYLRKEYARSGLAESDLDADPVLLFGRWLGEALVAEVHEAHAMTLATATPDGMPSARVVLLRQVDERGFVFYTNYRSRKGRELDANPRAALVFYWPELQRQVRVEGRVELVSDAESDDYFRTRPRDSRLGALASEQSEVIADRDVLEARLRELSARYPGEEVPRPPHWGGYRLVPSALEFWQGRPSRLHDRFRYEREGGTWKHVRLSP
jgi:pyridoxamine 5'-phosphate oxidase